MAKVLSSSYAHTHTERNYISIYILYESICPDRTCFFTFFALFLFCFCFGCFTLEFVHCTLCVCYCVCHCQQLSLPITLLSSCSKYSVCFFLNAQHALIFFHSYGRESYQAEIFAAAFAVFLHLKLTPLVFSSWWYFLRENELNFLLRNRNYLIFAVIKMAFFSFLDKKLSKNDYCAKSFFCICQK